MFYLQFDGSTNDAVTAVNAMTASGPESADQTLLATAKTAAISAINGNYLNGGDYTGQVQLIIRGGYLAGATTLSIKLNNITRTAASTPRIRTGDPTMSLSPQ